ncbi:DNRLRE domain-containing protein [bacterium]|nr:DNRLRE domain-containing protein [candidate division CSSED10-310 bacterium]
MKRSVLFLSLTTALFVSTAHGDVIDLLPQLDTYTIPAGGQFGSLDSFWAGKRPSCDHDENAMIQFDLTPYSGMQVESATLHINRFFGCSVNVTNADFYHAEEIWDESHSGGHVQHGSQVWANEIFNANGWWAIDLTSLVDNWLTGTLPNFGLVIEPRTGSGTSKFHSREAADEKLRPFLQLVLTGQATPTQTPTPSATTSPETPTPAPTATPGNHDTTFVDIDMPSDFFRPGSPCECTVTIHNMEGHTLDNCPLCVILNVYGQYFFAPSLRETFDYYSDLVIDTDIPLTVTIIPEFSWPAGAGSADNIQWLSALLTPDLTNILGDMDVFVFGWSN